MVIIACCAIGSWFSAFPPRSPDALPRALYISAMLVVPVLLLVEKAVYRRSALLTFGEWAGCVPLGAPVFSVLLGILMKEHSDNGIAFLRLIIHLVAAPAAAWHLWAQRDVRPRLGWLDTLGSLTCLGTSVAIVPGLWALVF